MIVSVPKTVKPWQVSIRNSCLSGNDISQEKGQKPFHSLAVAYFLQSRVIHLIPLESASLLGDFSLAIDRVLDKMASLFISSPPQIAGHEACPPSTGLTVLLTFWCSDSRVCHSCTNLHILCYEQDANLSDL